jgi:hypothetical protein
VCPVQVTDVTKSVPLCYDNAKLAHRRRAWQTKKVQRVDEIPLVIHWLLKMRVAEIIDHVWPYPHRNRRGLSYGQLAVLLVAYVLHLRTHRLSGMEEWLESRRQVLVQATEWEIGPKEVTDDRLGDLLTVLGQDREGCGGDRVVDQRAQQGPVA